MANPQRRSSQRPSRDSSVSSHRGENIFSDENEIESFGVADGFRPTFTLQDAPSARRISNHQSSSIRNATSPARDTKKKPLPSQQSVQPLISRNSFSLQNDAQYSDAPRRGHSMASHVDDAEAPATRPHSILSRQSTYARPQSTYTGPSAPSHPYGMYPQNANEPVRHASVASSHRPVRERSYMGSDRPAHPYGMYPQNTVSDNETDALAGSTDIASVGFPGLRQQFARRLGPNGEDADDIIGPDGHTEQLPPYTQYPDVSVATNKARMAAIPQSPQSPQSPILQEPSRVANPATSDNDALLSPTTRMHMGEPASRPQRFSHFRPRDRWGEKGRRRTCFGRMPCWLVVLIIFCMVALGALGGGLLGHFLSNLKHHDKSSGSISSASDMGSNSSASAAGPTPNPPPAPSTVTTPPASPSNLTETIGGANAAPTGIYSIIISSLSQTSDSCLQNKTQKPAWNCANSLQLNLNVENPYNARALVTLTSTPGPNMYFGDQNYSIPIQGKIDKFLVKDPDDPELNEAYYFSTTYDKQVILDQNDLVPTNTKRSEFQQINRRDLQKRDSPILPGQMVWSCWWNNTLIDGFIYVDQPLSSTTSSSSAPAPAPTGNSKRYLFGRDSYSRRMKIREIRQGSVTPPQCTLMQYVNNTLVPPAQPQPPITLNESSPPPQQNMAMSRLHRAWSKEKDREKDRDKDSDYDHHRDDDDDEVQALPASFCDCTWMFDH